MLAYGDSVTSSEASVISAYNTELSARVSAFETANSGITTYVFDTQVPFNTALSAPATYGATNATCFDADGTTCLWFNDLHPGQAIQKLVAEGVAGQVSGDFFQGGDGASASASSSGSSATVVASSSGVPVSSAVQSSSPVAVTSASVASTAVSSLAISSAAAVVTPVSSISSLASMSVVTSAAATASSTQAASTGDDECEV